MSEKPFGIFPSFRRLSAVFVSVALVLALLPLVACTDSESNKMHLTLKVPRTGHDVVFDDSITQIDQVIYRMVEDFEKNYDGAEVDIEVEVFEQNEFDSAIVDCFDTDRAADILYSDYFNMSTYIYSGRVVPLDDIIDKGLRESIYGFLWEGSMVDGRTYMMPYLNRQNILAYKKDLFRQVGLEDYIEDDAIQSWTIEEWTYILDTLAANLPESVYPMMMYAASSQGDTHIMTLLRSAGSQFFDENGYFDISTPEGIAALRWIQDGVDRGWFPPHSENLEIEDCSSLFLHGQLAIYMVNNASIERHGDTIGLVNFPGPDEDGCATMFLSGFEVFDNGDAQKVQVAKDFLKYVYESEYLMDYAAGAMPASKKTAEKYGDEICNYELFLNNRSNLVDFTGINQNTRATREVFYPCIHELLMKNITPEETAAMIDERCNAIINDAFADSILHE